MHPGLIRVSADERRRDDARVREIVGSFRKRQGEEFNGRDGMAPTYLLPVGPTHFSPLPLPKSSPRVEDCRPSRVCAAPTVIQNGWRTICNIHLACIVIPTHHMRQVNLLANDAEKLLFAMFSFNLGWTAPVMIVFSLFGLVREARMASACHVVATRGMLCTWHAVYVA